MAGLVGIVLGQIRGCVSEVLRLRGGKFKLRRTYRRFIYSGKLK